MADTVTVLVYLYHGEQILHVQITLPNQVTYKISEIVHKVQNETNLEVTNTGMETKKGKSTQIVKVSMTDTVSQESLQENPLIFVFGNAIDGSKKSTMQDRFEQQARDDEEELAAITPFAGTVEAEIPRVMTAKITKGKQSFVLDLHVQGGADKISGKEIFRLVNKFACEPAQSIVWIATNGQVDPNDTSPTYPTGIAGGVSGQAKKGQPRRQVLQIDVTLSPERRGLLVHLPDKTDVFVNAPLCVNKISPHRLYKLLQLETGSKIKYITRQVISTGLTAMVLSSKDRSETIQFSNDGVVYQAGLGKTARKGIIFADAEGKALEKVREIPNETVEQPSPAISTMMTTALTAPKVPPPPVETLSSEHEAYLQMSSSILCHQCSGELSQCANAGMLWRADTSVLLPMYSKRGTYDALLAPLSAEPCPLLVLQSPTVWTTVNTFGPVPVLVVLPSGSPGNDKFIPALDKKMPMAADNGLMYMASTVYYPSVEIFPSGLVVSVLRARGATKAGDASSLLRSIVQCARVHGHKYLILTAPSPSLEFLNAIKADTRFRFYFLGVAVVTDSQRYEYFRTNLGLA